MLEQQDLIKIPLSTSYENLKDFEMMIGIYDHEILTANIKKLDLIYHSILGS